MSQEKRGLRRHLFQARLGALKYTGVLQRSTDIRLLQIINGTKLGIEQIDRLLRNRRGLLNEPVQIRATDFQEIEGINAVVGFERQFYRDETLKLAPRDGRHTMRLLQLRVP